LKQRSAVQINRRRLEVDRHALGRHDLHAVTGQDVLLDGVDGFFVIALGEAGAEHRVSRLLLAEVQATTWGDRLTEFFQQLFQARATLFESVFLRRVGQDDGVHLAGQVVEHNHRIRHHQQNVRYAQRVRVRAFAQALFHITHAVITEVTHQAAVEARQASDGSARCSEP
jgi:hypothetical protein